MSKRNTTVRDKHRHAIARDEPPCAICRQPIDYDLPHLDPGAFVVDHIIPLSRGGVDALENKQPAHRNCNRSKSDRMPEEAPRIYETERDW